MQKKLRTHIARAHIFRRIIVKHLYGKLVFVEKSLSLLLNNSEPLSFGFCFFSYYKACGIFLDQGSNQHPLHWEH